ncbi:MAG: L-glyceraldehyde 3-phosphate reductase [Candidatus Latescibacteria bacterium]|nr:L-glyceraldehyde 3-phosphate reductase [Candidatus Latescibacterota bacterium]
MEFSAERYQEMTYNRCGSSGLQLPVLSLGCWNNFDDKADPAAMLALLSRAFDLGITHFDLANNYGPAPGAAETNVGHLLNDQFKAHRDELIISTKAGYGMWPGPYGDGGSKKYLVASLDQSLQRLGLDYVDIFYHHRPDPDTPMEESLDALDLIVRQGKALYAGVSNYKGQGTAAAHRHLADRGLPLTVNQVSYNMLQRGIETDLLPYAQALGVGVVAFVPLAQGLLTNKYLGGIPTDSRAARPEGTLQSGRVTPEVIARVEKLAAIAQRRGQSVAQLALSWVLRDARITTALIGASRPEQIDENVAALSQAPLDADELAAIDAVLQD